MRCFDALETMDGLKAFSCSCLRCSCNSFGLLEMTDQRTLQDDASPGLSPPLCRLTYIAAIME